MTEGATPSLPSAAERSGAGRAMRTAVPRAVQAAWSPSENRTDPIAALRATEAGRLSELLGLRYGRMAVSPFGFLRGAAAIMAADLATTPHSGLRVQACGDAHIGNFRLLGTPERALNFDLNDFDETLPAPFEWDLKRLAASAIVAGRHNGFSARECRNVATKAARSYHRHTEEYAGRSALDIWYSRIDSETLESVLKRENLGRKQNRMLRKRMSRARDKSHQQALRRFTTVVDGHTRLREDPPLIYHEPATKRWWRASCTRTAKVCATTCGCCSIATNSSTTRSGSAASAASARGAGSRSSRVTTATPTTPSSCR